MYSQLISLMLRAEQTADAAEVLQPNPTETLLTYLVLTVLFLAMIYLVMIRPQKKKEKESKEMRDNLQIGDEVTTIGGITGIIVRKTEDTVVIETGGDRSKIRVKIWAISENVTVHDAAEEAVNKKK